MLHMTKMAVGVRDIKRLREVFDTRPGRQLIAVRTRNMPKRAAEILDGGSLYWIAGGSILGRHKFRDIREDRYEDGSKCALLLLEQGLVAVAPRKQAAQQGWRYLEAAAAPRDLEAGAAASGIEELPEEMRRELMSLGLL